MPLPETLLKFWDETKNTEDPGRVGPRSTKLAFFRCPQCRYTWQTQIGTMTKRKFPCQVCSASRPEKAMFQVLQDSGRSFQFQYLLPGEALKVDFWVEGKPEIIIEMEQFRKPAHPGIAESAKMLRARKQEWAAFHQIPFLFIPYAVPVEQYSSRVQEFLARPVVMLSPPKVVVLPVRRPVSETEWQNRYEKASFL